MIMCESLYGQPYAVVPERLIFRPSVYALIPHAGKIVLITIRGTGKYGLPGGAVEPHERLEQALIREVREETGLAVSVERLLHFKETLFYYDPSDSAFHTLSFFFLCHSQTVTLIADELVDDGELPEAMCPRWINPYMLRPDEIQGFFTDVIALLPDVLPRN
jgi:8-oxo-dGTP pyrophosphatase MutT (NUDIX family)